MDDLGKFRDNTRQNKSDENVGFNPLRLQIRQKRTSDGIDEKSLFSK